MFDNKFQRSVVPSFVHTILVRALAFVLDNKQLLISTPLLIGRLSAVCRFPIYSGVFVFGKHTGFKFRYASAQIRHRMHVCSGIRPHWPNQFAPTSSSSNRALVLEVYQYRRESEYSESELTTTPWFPTQFGCHGRCIRKYILLT